MDLQSTKILVAVLFFIVRFFFGMMPVRLYTILRKWEGDDGSNTFVNRRRHAQVNCAMALCQSFGGGVLFATCFLHMMLEVFQSVEDIKKNGNLNTEYPISQLIISVGFFLVYFVEEICHWIITRFPDKPLPPMKKKFKNFITVSIVPIEKGEIKNPKFSSKEDEYDEITEKGVTGKKKSAAKSENTCSEEKFVDGVSLDDNPENIVYDSLGMNSEVARMNRKNLDLDEAVDGVVVEVQKEATKCKLKSQQQLIRFLFIVVALSFHAFFEGLAIGLEDHEANIWYMFIAVCIHSATILFCMGLELLLAKAKMEFICIHMLALASASSIGVLLGLLVTFKSDMESKTKSTAVVLLEGLSAGTILYITFFEILNREKEKRICRMKRAVCILGGFSLMAVLQYLKM